MYGTANECMPELERFEQFRKADLETQRKKLKLRQRRRVPTPLQVADVHAIKTEIHGHLHLREIAFKP